MSSYAYEGESIPLRRPNTFTTAEVTPVWRRETHNRNNYRYVHASGRCVVRKSGEGPLSRPEWEIVDVGTGATSGGYYSASNAKFVAAHQYRRRMS